MRRCPCRQPGRGQHLRGPPQGTLASQCQFPSGAHLANAAPGRLAEVDELGWYWAELFRVGEGQTAEWLVFNPEGVAQGIVELPADFDVHYVGATYVLGVWEDELGVEHIRRYAVDRGGDQ